MENGLPKRKPVRLKNYDYSTIGAYFVTICVQDRKPILSEVIKTNEMYTTEYALGYAVQLKPCGEIVKKHLLALADRYKEVVVSDYVIMPDHIHTIIVLRKNSGGASPSPTVSSVICALKSLVARECKAKFGIEKMFQRSFQEHIVRDKEDYDTRKKYIYENPLRWHFKQLDKEKK